MAQRRPVMLKIWESVSAPMCVLPAVGERSWIGVVASTCHQCRWTLPSWSTLVFHSQKNGVILVSLYSFLHLLAQVRRKRHHPFLWPGLKLRKPNSLGLHALNSPKPISATPLLGQWTGAQTPSDVRAEPQPVSAEGGLRRFFFFCFFFGGGGGSCGLCLKFAGFSG